jgi:enoyl-CoA hydratase/carnithine racemase
MDTVQYRLEDGVAFLTLNRPERLNAGSAELLDTLLKLIFHCESDSAVRALHLTGSGRAFSAGFDMRDVPADKGDDEIHEHFRWMAMLWHEVLASLVRIDKPVVAAVNGLAVGGGLGLACASDMAIAGESATFLMSYHSIGLTPDATTTYHLPRYIGMRRAIEWAYTNRTLSARDAEAWGLINWVVPDDQLLAQTTALAQDLAQGPTPIIGRTKQLFHGSWNEPVETQAEMEKQSIMWSVRQRWFQEGLREFTEKRGRPAARRQTRVGADGH